MSPEPLPVESASDAELSLASTGLLSFYDRLRQRLTDFAARRGGKLGSAATTILLLAPDLFVLLLRLSLDDRVPGKTRQMILGALVYFITPVDMLPEAFLGPGGFLDDVFLACLVLSVALGPDLEPLAESYWNGPQRLRVLLADTSRLGRELLGDGFYERLRRLLARWGVNLRDHD